MKTAQLPIDSWILLATGNAILVLTQPSPTLALFSQK